MASTRAMTRALRPRFRTRKTAMAAAGKKYDPVIYDGAGHGFMRAGEDPANTNPANATARGRGLEAAGDAAEGDVGPTVGVRAHPDLEGIGVLDLKVASWGSCYPRSQNRDLGHPHFVAGGEWKFEVRAIPGLKIETWGTHISWWVESGSLRFVLSHVSRAGSPRAHATPC